MKKYLVFGMMSALALAFAACSSEEELVTPVVNGQAVKTQLAINLPTGLKATRQQVTETQGQETPVFRGISDFHVAAFNTAASLRQKMILFIVSDEKLRFISEILLCDEVCPCKL